MVSIGCIVLYLDVHQTRYASGSVGAIRGPACPAFTTMHASSERLFIAVMPPDPIRAALAAWRDAWHWPKSASLVATPKLHLTLHFLDDVASADIDALRLALDHPFQPFDIDLGTAALWHGGVAVVEPLAVPHALSALHSRLGALLDQAGIEREDRPYHPHVTFARRAAGAVPPAGFPLHWHIDSVDLMASRNGLYESIQHYRASEVIAPS